MRIITRGSYPMGPLRARNDNTPSRKRIDEIFQSSIHDIRLLCRLWNSGSGYAQQRVYLECKFQIKQTIDISCLIQILYEINAHSPGLRDSLGSIFEQQLQICRLQKQSCDLFHWKKAIPGLNRLGLLEENAVFYDERHSS